MKYNKFFIVFALVALFIISIICGFLVNSYINFSKKESNNTAILADSEHSGNNIVKTSSAEVTVSPNCKIVKIEKFLKCGHTITRTEIAPREIVNLNEDAVKEFYKDWSINSFTSDEIKISRECSGICDEHYILRESNGYISISSRNNIGEYIFKGLTDIPVQYLPAQDLDKLTRGIEIVGKDNLNKFLEDFE